MVQQQILERRRQQAKKYAETCLDEFIKSRKLMGSRSRVKTRVMRLVRMYERREERERRTKAKFRRQRGRYTPDHMPRGWFTREVGMRGSMFSPCGSPFNKNECATWCKFFVKMRSATDKRVFFHFGVYFDWEEVDSTKNEMVYHENVRAVARYRHVDGNHAMTAKLHAVASDIIGYKYPHLEMTASMCGINLKEVMENAFSKI